jgi:hypothetical protein
LQPLKERYIQKLIIDMKKLVLQVVFISILILSYTAASAQVATIGSLALRVAQTAHPVQNGNAILISTIAAATPAAKHFIPATPASAQNKTMSIVADTFTIAPANTALATEMAEELSLWMAKEEADRKKNRRKLL